jgi:hypothetical protein
MSAENVNSRYAAGAAGRFANQPAERLKVCAVQLFIQRVLEVRPDLFRRRQRALHFRDLSAARWAATGDRSWRGAHQAAAAADDVDGSNAAALLTGGARDLPSASGRCATRSNGVITCSTINPS